MKNKLNKQQLLIQIRELTMLANSQYGTLLVDKSIGNTDLNRKIIKLRRKYHGLL